MRPLIVFSVLLVLATSLSRSGPQTEEILDPSAEIMWQKLDLSHHVLEALSLDDFEALAAYAEDLAALSDAGASFAGDKEGYLAESRGFRRAAEALGKGARARDTEEAALAYVDLTLRCVRCHRSLGEIPRR